MKTYQQYINGAWVAPLNGKYTEVYNPSDDSVVGMVANGDEKDADLALQAAQAAQKSWAKLTARRRAEIRITSYNVCYTKLLREIMGKTNSQKKSRNTLRLY